jgi:hypothetical protein
MNFFALFVYCVELNKVVKLLNKVEKVGTINCLLLSGELSFAALAGKKIAYSVEAKKNIPNIKVLLQWNRR